MIYSYSPLYCSEKLEYKDGKFILTTIGQDDVWEETITFEQARKFAVENIRTLSELKEFTDWCGIDYLDDCGDGSHENINVAYFRDRHLVCPYRDELIWKGQNFSIFKVNGHQILGEGLKPLPFMYIYMHEDNRIVLDGKDIDIKIKGGKILLKFDENDIASVEECDTEFENNPF